MYYNLSTIIQLQYMSASLVRLLYSHMYMHERHSYYCTDGSNLLIETDDNSTSQSDDINSQSGGGSTAGIAVGIVAALIVITIVITIILII